MKTEFIFKYLILNFLNFNKLTHMVGLPKISHYKEKDRV